MAPVIVAAAAAGALGEPASIYPRGPEPAPVACDHFPSRLHAFLWRNWGLVPDERIARVLGASVEDVSRVAASMGLPERTSPSGEMLRRGYITLIRRNWHLLPYEQLLLLLDWSPERLVFTLREDDFLWTKLGSLKPRCEPLVFREPSADETAWAARTRDLVTSLFGERWFERGEPRFRFIAELSEPLPPRAAVRSSASSGASSGAPSSPASPAALSPRFLYSYFALYGDPLLEPELDPFPDGYLERLARCGVDAVWLQGVLRQLSSSPLFPEESRDAEKRLAALQALAARARKRGIGIYLYLNEPRSMPARFYEQHPGLKGTAEGDRFALCTSTAEVQQFLRDGVRQVLRSAPDLRGVFTITMSENLTSCHSHGRGAGCPRCSKRSGPEVVAEVNRLIAEGAREGKADAEVIAWDWGWPDGWVEEIVSRLPENVRLQSVSEWSLPIRRGGIDHRVGEYSISAVGPGPRAARNWSLAEKRGLRTGAKVQINNTWELCTVPYIPALQLVAEHLRRLRETRVSSLMLGWTLGGWPSPNLEVASAFYGEAAPSPAAAVQAVAERIYGEGAGDAVEAWRLFSEAFGEFPFDVQVLYSGPQQVGPANLLHGEPSGYRATMVGFPYDDLDAWRGVYPAETFAAQLEKLADGWDRGIARLERALERSGETQRREARRDADVARACGLHFRSVAEQARWLIARRRLREAGGAEGRLEPLQEMERRCRREEGLARALFPIAARDSRIGYEASNHYYYLPRDLVEKVINCRHLCDAWLPRRRSEP